MIRSYKERSKKAFTFVEMVITVGLFSFVSIFISYLSLEVARQTRSATSEMPIEQNALRALDYIKMRLVAADFSTLAVSNSNQTITFDNPVLGTTCSLTFDQVEQEVIYDPDTSTANNEATFGREVRGTFALADNRGTVRTTVSAVGMDRKGNTVVYSFEDNVLVRN